MSSEHPLIRILRRRPIGLSGFAECQGSTEYDELEESTVSESSLFDNDIPKPWDDAENDSLIVRIAYSIEEQRGADATITPTRGCTAAMVSDDWLMLDRVVRLGYVNGITNRNAT